MTRDQAVRTDQDIPDSYEVMRTVTVSSAPLISTSFITSQALILREQIRKRMNSGVSWPRSMEMTRIIGTQNITALMRVIASHQASGSHSTFNSARIRTG